MANVPQYPQHKSAERHAFEIYLRTGRRLAVPQTAERKFNPYHDPRNGQFTFAPGGPRSAVGAAPSTERGLWKRKRAHAAGEPKERDNPAKPADPGAGARVRSLGDLPDASFQLAGGNRRRPRGGGRSGKPPTDPLLLDEVFPGLSKSPAGTVIRLADGVLELGSAARAATREIHRAQVRRLVAQIQAVDPSYRYESLGEPDTIAGQANEIKALRFKRALAFYRERNELRPLQVEVLRVMQDRAASAYEEAVALYNAGRLTPRLSREEAIGNHIDRAVRADLRAAFNFNRIDTSVGQPIRVVGREYDTSGTDRTYRIPDARIGIIAFDVTLTRKTMSTPQVRGYFRADFRPKTVVIIRPRQLGGTYTYAITRPDND